MFRIPNHNESSSSDPVVLTEWDHIGPGSSRRLEGTSLQGNVQAQRLADSLRSRLDIREGYSGLEIISTSHVGRVDVGPLSIVIVPKLPAMPLATLLRYTYGLRDVSTIEATLTPTTFHGLHDLLIAMLAAEVEELLHRGLARRYVSLSEKLENPRGRILLEVLMRQGGITEARPPCRHFERQVNWQLNQVLRAGLGIAARMTEDRDLRLRLHRLAGMFGDVEQRDRLDLGDIDQAEHGLTRLTLANAPALTIIRLLEDMQELHSSRLEQQVRRPDFCSI